MTPYERDSTDDFEFLRRDLIPRRASRKVGSVFIAIVVVLGPLCAVVRLLDLFGPLAVLAYLALLAVTICVSWPEANEKTLWLLGGSFAVALVWALIAPIGQEPGTEAYRVAMRHRLEPLQAAVTLGTTPSFLPIVLRLWRGERGDGKPEVE